MLGFFINIARAEKIPNPLGYDTVSGLICGVASAFAVIAGAIATVMVLYGAFQILTAGGEPKKFEEGKHTIVYAAIGFAIVLLAGGIVSLVGNLLGSAGIQTGIFSCGRSASVQSIPQPVNPAGALEPQGPVGPNGQAPTAPAPGEQGAPEIQGPTR